MRSLVSIVVVALLAACGPKSVFRLSADENNAYALHETLQRRQLPSKPTPVNSSGQPRVFVLAAGSPKTEASSTNVERAASPEAMRRTIIAFDLAQNRVMWKADGDVKSRIYVGGDFVATLEGKQLVARDQERGTPRWRADLDGSFVGAAADRDRAYVVTKDGDNYRLAAYAGNSGKRLWKDDASGKLGAPGAHGGVVYVPFLDQWLSIIDGASGQQLTRLRGIDEQISTLRVTSTIAYYGSKQGMFRLDDQSATGRRADASYGKVEVPPQLERTTYSRDSYDPVQQTYTAADRSRVLWATLQNVGGPMQFTDYGFAVHYFRYVLGFDLKGALRWAYSNPRVELVASEHTDAVIAAVSATGEIVALDPLTGAVRARMDIGAGGQVLGATFDADGWAPTGGVERTDPMTALVSIARDRDQRFERVKELAVVAIARLPGDQSTRELLGVLTDDRAAIRLRDTVVELLVRRRDPGSVPVLAEQLAVHDDVIAKTEASTLGPTARALSGLAETRIDPVVARPVLAALTYHLDAPSTAIGDLILVIDAMTAVGAGAEKAALASHLLLYHADDDRGGDPAWQKAIINALATHPTPADRAVLAYVAADPRTEPGLVRTIAEVTSKVPTAGN